MRKVAILLVLLISVLFVPNGAAETKEVNVSIEAITITNNSLMTVRVNGTLFNCENNTCLAIVTTTCSDCPECPTEVNTSRIIDELSEYIHDNNTLLLNELTKVNNDLNKSDVLLMVEEQGASTSASIEEYLHTTLIPKQSDFDNLTAQNTELTLRNSNLERDIQDMLVEQQTYKNELEDTTMYFNYTLGIVALVIAVMIALAWKQHGFPAGFGRTLRFGMSKDEREEQNAEMKRRKELDEYDKKVAEAKHQFELTKRAEELHRYLQTSDSNITTTPVNNPPVNFQQQLGNQPFTPQQVYNPLTDLVNPVGIGQPNIRPSPESQGDNSPYQNPPQNQGNNGHDGDQFSRPNDNEDFEGNDAKLVIREVLKKKDELDTVNDDFEGKGDDGEIIDYDTEVEDAEVDYDGLLEQGIEYKYTEPPTQKELSQLIIEIIRRFYEEGEGDITFNNKDIQKAIGHYTNLRFYSSRQERDRILQEEPDTILMHTTALGNCAVKARNDMILTGWLFKEDPPEAERAKFHKKMWTIVRHGE